jgi:hypothetical protein
MDWFLKIIRIAGASCPGAASLLQLQAELDGAEIKKRIDKLSDPISFLHNDVQKVAKEIYTNLKSADSLTLNFDSAFYTKYSRPLAALDAKSLIKSQHAIGSPFAAGIYLCDPTFIMYLCALSENSKKMQRLIELVDSCAVGASINGKNLQPELELPLQVIKAVFEIYRLKGFGLVSKEIGSAYYIGKA